MIALGPGRMMALVVRTHPVYRDRWAVIGPAVHGDAVSIWHGPDTLRACLKARERMERARWLAGES